MRKATLALVVSVFSSLARAEAPVPDPDLAKGKEQVRQGEYDAGIATLTEVVRRLLAGPNRDAETADAYLHLGIAYAGLGQISPARTQFVQALRRDPAIAPDPKAPPLALEAFAAARREAASEGVLAAAQRAKKKGPGTKIALGAGAVAVGVGVALAAGAGGQSIAPPRAMFVPLSASPYIQLVSTQPDPGTTFSSNQPVSLTVQTANPPEPLRFLYVAEAITADRRVCLSGQAGPFGIGPGGSVSGTFAMSPKCTAPFTTETLEVSLQDVDTKARLYRAIYRVIFQVVP